MPVKPPPLTDAENARWYSKFFYERYQADPAAQAQVGVNGEMKAEEATPKEDRFRILQEAPLPRERGWRVMPDGTTFVAGMVEMPGVTPEMFEWWFSWMVLDPLRSRLWDPEEHFSMVVDESCIDRLTNPNLTVQQRLYGNQVYGVEDNGTGFESDRYSFKKLNWRNPLDFGFTAEQITEHEAKGGRLITMQSGPKDGDFESSFCHCAHVIPGGCRVRSWFWVGNKIGENGTLVKTMPEDMPLEALQQIGIGLSAHCLREYTNLGHILPEAWEKCHNHVDTMEEYESYKTIFE